MKHRILAIVCSIAAAFTASAQVPSLINYQGRLTDSNGAPVTGNKNIAISIYDAATGGNLLYEETIGAVTLDANGVYSFQFGSAGSSSTQVTDLQQGSLQHPGGEQFHHGDGWNELLEPVGGQSRCGSHRHGNNNFGIRDRSHDHQWRLRIH
jgi:hypothetical protein